MLGGAIGYEEYKTAMSALLKRVVKTATEIAMGSCTRVEIETGVLGRGNVPLVGKSLRASFYTDFAHCRGWCSTEVEVSEGTRDAVIALTSRVSDRAVVLVSHDAQLKDSSSIPKDERCFKVPQLQNGKWLVHSTNGFRGGNGNLRANESLEITASLTRVSCGHRKQKISEQD